jgi:hypothetical protein
MPRKWCLADSFFSVVLPQVSMLSTASNLAVSTVLSQVRAPSSTKRLRMTDSEGGTP